VAWTWSGVQTATVNNVFTYADSASSTFNAPLAGNGTVVVANASGTLTLNNSNNTYTGSTILNSGVLKAGGIVYSNNSYFGSPAAGNEPILVGDTTGTNNVILYLYTGAPTYFYRPIYVRAGSSGTAILDNSGNGGTITLYNPITFEKSVLIKQAGNGTFNIKNVLSMAGAGTPALVVNIIGGNSLYGVQYYSATAPNHTGGTQLTGTTPGTAGIFPAGNGFVRWQYPGTPGDNLLLRFGNSPGGGPGTITLDGGTFSLYPQLASGTATYSNDNVIVVTTNSGVLGWQLSGGANNTNYFLGPISLGGILGIGDLYTSASSVGHYTGTITINQLAGTRAGLMASRNSYTACYLDGNIVDGAGTAANSLLLRGTTASANPPFFTATGSTYTNGTVVEGDPTGLYEVTSPSGSLGLGNFWLLEGGRIRMDQPFHINTAGGAKVTLYGNLSVLSVLALAANFCPNFSSDSVGVLAIDTTGYNAVTSQATLGNQVFLGSVNGGSFTGSTLSPCADNIYRLGGGGGSLTISNSVLTGAGNAVQVGHPCGGSVKFVNATLTLGNGSGTIILKSANTYAGGSTVNANTVLEGQAQTSGSPFGSTTAGVTLNDGTLQLDGINTATITNTIGPLTINGYATVVMNQSGSLTNTLSINSLAARSSATPWTAVFNGSTATTLGGKERIVIANSAPVATNNMVAPYLVTVNSSVPDFLTYKNSTDAAGTIGFTNTSAYYVTVGSDAALQAPHSTDIVNVTTNINLTGPANVYALRVNGVNITNAASLQTITIGSGGLVLNTASAGVTISNNLAFGAEAVAFVSYNAATLSGNLSGTNGFTKSGSASITLSGNNLGLTGTTAVVQGTMSFSADANLGAPANPIYLDGGALTCLTGNTTNNRAVYLGPAGGSLEGNAGVNALFTWGGPITGPGMLTKSGTGNGILTLTNANNTYAGGTVEYGRLINVTATSSLGVGDVTVTYQLALYGDRNIGGGDFYGNNTTNRQARLSIEGSGTVNFYSAHPSIGSLSGSGLLELSNTVLTVGGDNSSSLYCGVICQNTANTTGSLVKVGSGRLTFKGLSYLPGTTLVSNGTFAVDGSMAGGITVSSGAKLVGAGTVGGPLIINSGATFQPGGSNTVGTMTSSGALTLSDNSNIVMINIKSASKYDQVVANGVNLNNATLQVTLEYAPTSADVFYIVSNTSASPIVGTFNGLPENSLIHLPNGYVGRISYLGTADSTAGNDVKIFNITKGENGSVILLQ
jgi:autotransporter-associated beta strand protein